MKKFTFGMIVIMSLAVSASGLALGVKKKNSDHYTAPYPGVVTPAFSQLPLGAVKPKGWLKGTLQAWGEGITGHLHEYRSDTFWNTWDDRRFRKENRESFHSSAWWPFEQQGYWGDGIVQTAYILDDQRLKGVADEFINRVLAGQNPDGYMGITPDEPYSDTGDVYVLSELTLGLMSYYSATEDPRIIQAMQKGFKHILENCKPLSGDEDSLPPGFEWPVGLGATAAAAKHGLHPAWIGTGWPYACHIIDAVLWVYSKTGDPQMKELADVIYDAMQQVPSDFQTKHLLLDGRSIRDHHGVDVAETIRIPALYYLYSGDERDLQATIKALESVERYHGLVYGGPASDEHLRYPSTISNTEFCTHTVFNYTKQQMFAITGDVQYADGIERALFNVAPGSARPDGKAMQYFTAPNQVASTSTSCNLPFGVFNDGQLIRPDGDPSTQCCVGEATRLYPNYIATAMWLASQDNGLAAACYGPSTVSAKVGEQGKVVRISEQTNYPFEEKIRFVVESSESVKFPLYLRIPGWCNEAGIKINGETYAVDLVPGKMVKIERDWSSGDRVELDFPMHIRFSRGDRGSVAVERGPLVYALKIKHNWKNLGERFAGFPDWEVRPGSAWNYALILDLSYGKDRMPAAGDYFTIKYADVSKDSNPWEYPPIELVCKAKKVDGWKILKGDVTPHVPQSPVVNDNPEEMVTLVPYGSTRIRITYFPVAEVSSK